MRLLTLAGLASLCLGLAACGAEDITPENINKARDGINKARNFDRAAAEREVRKRVKQPLRDVSCPLKPRFDANGSVRVNCKAVGENGKNYTVPVVYTPGQGFQVEPPLELRSGS